MKLVRTLSLGMAAGVVALAGTALTPVDADAVEYKFATFWNEKHPTWGGAFKPWIETVEKQTNGDLKIQPFLSRKIGVKAPPKYVHVAINKQAELAFALPGYTSSLFPRAQITELPGVADDGIDGTKKMWQLMNDHLSKDFDKAGLVPIALFNTDIAIIMTKDKPVRTLADLQGLRVRVPSPQQGEQIKALGAIPRGMPITRVADALRLGKIDAALTPVTTTIPFGLKDVARYYTTGKVRFGISPVMTVMNKEKYNELPASSRKVVDETAGLKLSLAGAEAYQSRGQKFWGILRKNKDNNFITLTDAEAARWEAAMSGVISSWIERMEKDGVQAKAMLSKIK